MLARPDPGDEELFDRAYEAIDALQRRCPELSYLPSLRLQVHYLRAVASGAEPDRSRLTEINIGVITAKDIEDRDAMAAEILHAVAALARTMAADVPKRGAEA